jgi:membrane protein implicated in regulation of membrane protease activity
MSVLVMAAVVVVVDIDDDSLTAGMSVLLMMVAAVDTHDGSVDTVDWPLQLCMNLAVVVVAAAAKNTFLFDVENACLVVRGHASF